MNVLQVVPQMNVGGVETGTLDLAKYLVRLGHKAVVVSAGGQMVKELELYGAIHYELPMDRKSIFAILRMVPRLVEIIKKENIDIVHARSRVPAWVAYLASRRSGTAFITTCHGYYARHPFSAVMGWAKRVIVLSNVIGRHMIDDFRVPAERVRLIPRSVDLEKFKYLSPDTKSKEEFNVGIIARITPLKGHMHFIKAMAKAARVIPNLKIWIVGDAPASKGAYKEQLAIIIKRLGLESCTQFLGATRDIPEVMSSLDLLVLATTTHEAFGRVIIEAQASGVPVVATRVGGVIDIIEDEKTGLLVPPADHNSMADAVIRIYKDKNLACRLAQEAYEKVKQEYSVELMVKRTIGVYQEALSNFKILLIKLSSLGDIILSSAAIRAIRSKYGPQSYKISLLVEEDSRDVVLRCPYIDELLVCDLKNKDKGFFGLLKVARNLRKNNFDIVVDFQNNRKSHLLAYFSKAPNRYGYGNTKFGLLLNQRIKDEKPAMDPVTHQFRILKMMGIELKESRLELWPANDDAYYIHDFLASQWLGPNQKLVGINISASARWLTKNWPIRHMARLCAELNRKDIRAVITGTDKDLKAAEELCDMAGDIKLINACGKTTINQLACLIKSCGAYVSPDSASLHIAAAMGVPFVALFGPTDPRRHLPPFEDCVVVKKDLDCSLCYKSKCKDNKCMEMITAQEVMEAIDRLLK
jgi:lipopolysaccharide heptosyltransferase II